MHSPLPYRLHVSAKLFIDSQVRARRDYCDRFLITYRCGYIDGIQLYLPQKAIFIPTNGKRSFSLSTFTANTVRIIGVCSDFHVGCDDPWSFSGRLRALLRPCASYHWDCRDRGLGNLLRVPWGRSGENSHSIPAMLARGNVLFCG